METRTRKIVQPFQPSTELVPGSIRILVDEELDLIGASMYLNIPRSYYYDTMASYKNCFIGVHAIDYLVKLLKLNSREDAVSIGNQVLDKGIFCHVTNELSFCDKNVYYIFNEHWANNALKKQAAPNLQEPKCPIIEADINSEELMSFDSFSNGSPYEELRNDMLNTPILHSNVVGNSRTQHYPNQYNSPTAKEVSNTGVAHKKNSEVKSEQSNHQSEKGSKHQRQSDSEIEPAKKKRKLSKSQSVSAEQKLQQRAEKSRNASRLYRQRKKQFIEELKQKLDEVYSEKSAILQNMQKQQQLLQKLAEENSRLKSERVVDSNRLEGQRRELIKELIALTSKGETPDNCLEPILNQLENLNQAISKLGTNHLEELISPTTVGALVTSGFFKDRLPIVSTPNQGGLKELIDKLKFFVSDLTPKQSKIIENILKAHTDELEKWKQQRIKINEEIEGKLITNKRKEKCLNPLQPVILPDLMNLSITLEQLRQSLDGEAKTWENAVQKILEVLNVQQKCTFFLQCEYMHASLQQLKYLWSSIYGPCI